MKEEDKIWFNGVYPYFRMQKEINNLLILLKKFNTDMEEREDNFLKLTTELLRILPFKIDVDKKDNSIITGIHLLMNDGILLLNNYFPYLKNDYNNIINTYFIDLVQIIKIRNKYIHEPHNIKCTMFLCGGNNAKAGFKYKEEYYELNTDSLIKIIKEINKVFEKIKEKFRNKVDELSDEEQSHPYIQNVFNYYFENYNKDIDN